MKTIFRLKVAGLILVGLLFCFSIHAQQIDNFSKTAQTFEKIRHNEALLQYFFSKMPKGGDLHNHLTGSVYAETYFDIAVEEKLWLDPNTYILHIDKEDSSYIQLTKDMHDYRLRCIDHWSIRNFEHYQHALPPDEFFFATFGKFGKATDKYLVKFLEELRIRAEAENVQYLEIMVTGPKISSKMTEYEAESKNLIQYIEKKQESKIMSELSSLFQRWEGSDDFKKDIDNHVSLIDSLDLASSSTASSIKTYYQTYASRNVADPVKVFAQLYIGFKSCQKSKKLVGINIVQAENGDYALRDYWGHMRMFKYLNSATTTNDIRVHTSMHAGELTLGLVPPEDLQDHITEAVLVAKAERIGHGVDIAFEKSAPDLLKKMSVNGVAVEINLTSNEFILGVKGSTHPLMLYVKNKVPIVLSTDDPGILRTNLTQQYSIAALRYTELKYEDFRQFVLNSISYSFMPEKDKQEAEKSLNTKLELFENMMPTQIEELMGKTN